MKPSRGDAASLRTVTVIRPASGKLAALACGLVLVSSPALGACTDKNNSPSGTPSASASSGPVPQAALCADAAALRDSVGRLVNVTVVPGMADEIRDDANEVKADLTTFATNAHGSYQPQTDALRTALATLNGALATMSASPGTSSASAVQAARSQVATAAQNLQNALPPCPSGSSTSSPSSSPSVSPSESPSPPASSEPEPSASSS
jgi:hypothetical protein